MKLPLPTYGYFTNLYAIAEAINMFVTSINSAIKKLTAEPNMQFHSKNQMIQLIMYHAGLFMCEESFKDVEEYLGEAAGTLLRDFGGRS